MLGNNFEVAHHVHISLVDDIGFLGATPAVEDILEGPYVFPPDRDKHTHILLEEAVRIFAKTVEDVISTFVTTKDFQDWWLTADENIQLSKL